MSDRHEYLEYSVERMVPRVRNALARGIIDFGGLRFLSEGRIQLGGVFEYAQMVVRIHGKPFIMGWIDKRVETAPRPENGMPEGIPPDMSRSIAIAPLSEREHFVDLRIGANKII